MLRKLEAQENTKNNYRKDKRAVKKIPKLEEPKFLWDLKAQDQKAQSVL